MRLDALCRAFTGTPWEQALAGLDEHKHPGRVRSVIFRDDGSVVAVTSRPRNRESYHLAALIAYHLQLQDRGVISAAVPVEAEKKHHFALWALAVLTIVLVGGYALSRTPFDMGKLLGTFEPLPASIASTSTGRLKAGDFKFEGTTDVIPTYKPGELFQISYDLTGFGRDSDGMVDLQLETTLINASGSAASDPQTQRFHQKIASGNYVNGTFHATFSESARAGDYWIDIKVHDSVENTDLEFKPQLHLQSGLQPASQ